MADYEVTVKFVDVDGNETDRTFHLTAADNLAMATRANALINALNDVTLGVISGVTVKTVVNYNLPAGLRDTALAGAHRKEAGKFLMRTVTGFPTSFSVPTYDTEGQVSGEEILYTTSAEVQALIDEILTGGWTDERGDDINYFRKAYKTFGGEKA